jgi:hypothetical protein
MFKKNLYVVLRVCFISVEDLQDIACCVSRTEYATRNMAFSQLICLHSDKGVQANVKRTQLLIYSAM